MSKYDWTFDPKVLIGQCGLIDMYEHNALGYKLSLALCLTKVRSSRARYPATALISLKVCT